MRAAARDLGISLEILYGERNYVTTNRVANDLLNRKKLPDYIVLVNENDIGKIVMPRASELDIRIILINEGISAEDRKIFGSPGGKYKNWFAEYLPDDLQAGSLLADKLIRARMKQGDREINIVGLSGTVKTTSSSLRVRGLYHAAARYGNVKILQVVPAFWDVERADRVTEGLLGRYPQTDIVWAASDGMALGATRAIKRAGREPGRDILTGGIDWTDFSFDMVQSGEFTATVGGHFMDGAWALIMIYDDYHQHLKTCPSKSAFAAVTRENIAEFQAFFSNDSWNEVDFRKFSMTLNPGLRQYDFSIRAMLDTLRGKAASPLINSTAPGLQQD